MNPSRLKYGASDRMAGATPRGRIVGYLDDGVPVRASGVPTLTQRELDELPIVGDFNCDVFPTNDRAAMLRYKEIRDRAYQGIYQILGYDRQWDAASHIWYIYLEWVQLYAQAEPLGPAPMVPPPDPSQWEANFDVLGL